MLVPSEIRKICTVVSPMGPLHDIVYETMAQGVHISSIEGGDVTSVDVIRR